MNLNIYKIVRMVPGSMNIHQTNKSQMMKILLHGQFYAITPGFRKIRCLVLFLLNSEEKELVNEQILNIFNFHGSRS